MLYIPIILGTGREGRNSEKAAKFMLAEAQKAGLESEIVDVRDYQIKATNNTGIIPLAKEWREKVERSDGLIIICPEYNHSFPGELKMFLDMLYKPYAQKPIGICGVSIGSMGGARGVEQLRLVCIGLNMVPIGDAMYFFNVGKLFDENGKINDEAYHNRAKTFIDELVSFAETLNKKKGC